MKQPLTQEIDATKGKDSKVLDNDLMLEYIGEGGVVEYVTTSKIQWFRDIQPMFLATWTIIVIHMIYYFTGNLAIIVFLSQLSVLVTYIAGMESQIDKQNVSRKSERDYLKDKRFFIPNWTCILAGTFTWIWALCLFSEDVKFTSYYFSKVKPQTWAQYAIFHFLFGFISAVETQCGHELIHRRETYNKIMGMFAHAKIFYTHFIDDHVQGHHKMLATPEDPSTSRLNESFYAFVPREVYGTHKHSIKREVRRIQAKHGKDCPLLFLIVFNKMTLYFLIHLSICLTIYFTLGWASLKQQFMFAIVGITYESYANYITHYGLLRNKDKNGIYDSINKLHSWNFVSSPILFRLPRHSDHHISSFRPYQLLRRFDEAPWNPFQFTVSVYIALLPPLWFWAINPRALAARDFNNGIENKFASFNNIQKKTPHDMKVLRVCWTYFALITFAFGYLAFFSDSTNVLKQHVQMDMVGSF